MSGTIDLTQFYDAFFEEADEHLHSMEHHLMMLDEHTDDRELLDSIFRAAHSIKGSAGIFGFTALSTVTHVLESLLDKLRSGQMSVQSGMTNTLLHACDALKQLLNQYRQQTAPDLSLGESICRQLEAYIGGTHTSNNDEQDYGLFVEPVTGAKEESFGFFDEDWDKPSITESPKLENVAAMEPPKVPRRQVKATQPKESRTETAGSEATAVISESTTIRVSVEKIDQIINLVGELVITQSMLASGHQQQNIDDNHQEFALKLLERNTRDLQEAVMSIRLTPIALVFNRFPRVVRDLSQKLGKSVQLNIKGEQTELDKSLTEKLVDPLTHLVRNSIDHGIETPEVRSAAGKSETGQLWLNAQERNGNILVEVRDDGAGLNREKIIQKAKVNGLEIADDASDAEVWQLIFMPGFSTAEQVTDVSGRGVGMDVVRRNIRALGGRIDIESQAGQGTLISVRLPLTMAILDGMIVAVGDQRFIIPLVFISESLQPQSHQLKSIGGNEQLVNIRGDYISLFALHQLMDCQTSITDPTKGLLVILESEGRKIAILVDELLGQQQVVIKSLEANFRKVPFVSGATIMGDGRVALILSIEQLIRANDGVQRIREPA